MPLPAGNATWPTARDAAGEERAFDVKLVKSTLAWHGANDNVIDMKRSRRELAWIGSALKQRAAAAGVAPMVRSAGEKYWIPPEESEQGQAAFYLALFLGNGMHLDEQRRVFMEHVLRETPVYARLRLEGGISTLPWVNNVVRVTAYVIHLLIDNRHGVSDAIRLCPFTGRGFARPHLFLDYRIDEQGHRQRGQIQRFCCLAHGNAYAQRKHRADRTARTRKHK
jgi:hypothetical protein